MNSLHSLRLFLLAVFLFIGVTAVHAAIIRGKVMDVEYGEPLPGALISTHTSLGDVVAATDGSFEVRRIQPGTYEFEVSFFGYVSQRFTIVVESEDQVVEVQFSLEQSHAELGTVEVRARAQGTVLALKRQEEAPNIVNIVELEQIQSFPDLNAADAISRVSGITVSRDQGEGKYVQLRGTPPSFTNFNVNGIQLPSPETGMRTVGMDIINSSQIQTLEVSKVLTPDMNGDAIGGSVNIVTKRAETTTPQINAVAAGGFNNLRKTGNGELQFSYGARKERFGFLINANYMYTHQGADNIEFNYEKGVFFGDTGRNNYHIQYNDVQLRHYDVVRQRAGLSTTLDYQVDEHTTLILTGMYNRYVEDEQRRRKVYGLDDATSERNYLYGSIHHELRDRKRIQELSVVSLGAEHEYSDVIVDYEVSYARAIEEQPDRLEVSFSNVGEAIRIRFNMNDPEYPVATFPGNNGNATDYANFEFDQLTLEDYYSEDVNLNYRLNVKLPYGNSENGGFVKFGGLVRNKDKNRDITAQSYAAYFERSNTYPLPGPPLTLATVSDDFQDVNFLNRGYVLEAMPNGENMRRFFEEYRSLFVYGSSGITETRELTFGEDYLATEDIYAFYAMAQHQWKKLMIMGGVRYERTDISYEGYAITKTSSGYFEGLDTISATQTRDFWLPNLQLKYTLSPGFNLRAALTYNYARPNFNEVIPYRETVESKELAYGNPNLKYPTATNVDLLAEHYWEGQNMVSGGVFYKKIDNFIFNNQFFGYEGDPTQSNYSRYLIKIPLNGIAAHVRGAEIQTQWMARKVTTSWMRNLGVFANYTFTDSDAEMRQRRSANDFSENIIFGGDYDVLFEGEGVEHITLPGQAKHTLNLALFYDNEKFYIKLSANYHDAFLNELGVDKDLDEYYGEAWRLDANAYYQFTEHFQVFADVRNITNQPLRYYLGSPANQRVRQKEFYSFWARVGVRLKF
ncbi:TonB-dependent receptor [Phaeocystidibacter marisrubri]|uniref:TonB-dependent receptor n=1 Tax=Phaeocystidibacter marisrubri TaxID=1577780 RepID=A0A6L3ZH35_9FLAO|nr:TonB-dependent receptor [Phaeocystidibacter marisrubri]KAB2816269.1 TonB-dependent receptor [Phaeocystidibacter marisrubri]GGH68179.1 TonB-dependent receptor [Phaeocystidibacter marisrubri]